MDNIKSTYVTSENGIDFSHTSSETNGRGVYIDNTSINFPEINLPGNLTSIGNEAFSQCGLMNILLLVTIINFVLNLNHISNRKMM